MVQLLAPYIDQWEPQCTTLQTDSRHHAYANSRL